MGDELRVCSEKTKMTFLKTISLAAGGIVASFGARSFAATPEPWQFGFQQAATPVMERISSLHEWLLIVAVAIVVFVSGLLFYTLWKFSASRNPTPSTTTHNTLIEMAWTAVPVIILVLIAVPSFKLLYFADKVPKADFTVKAIGNQWYWVYEYPDHGKFAFEARMIRNRADLKPGQPYLLETDNAMVVPVNATVRVQVTAVNVIHAWAVPAFGVKIDAVPGRLNETWFKATREGTYYGQCSELCGLEHGFMPIKVQVVTREKFEEWATARKKAVGLQSGPSAQTVALTVNR